MKKHLRRGKINYFNFILYYFFKFKYELSKIKATRTTPTNILKYLLKNISINSIIKYLTYP